MRKMPTIHLSSLGNNKTMMPAMMARIGDKFIPNIDTLPFRRVVRIRPLDTQTYFERHRDASIYASTTARNVSIQRPSLC